MNCQTKREIGSQQVMSLGGLCQMPSEKCEHVKQVCLHKITSKPYEWTSTEEKRT